MQEKKNPHHACSLQLKNLDIQSIMKTVLVLMNGNFEQSFQPYPKQCLFNIESAILQSKETISYFLRNAEFGFLVTRSQRAALQTCKVLNTIFVFHTFQNITIFFAILSLPLTKRKKKKTNLKESI